MLKIPFFVDIDLYFESAEKYAKNVYFFRLSLCLMRAALLCSFYAPARKHA